MKVGKGGKKPPEVWAFFALLYLCWVDTEDAEQLEEVQKEGLGEALELQGAVAVPVRVLLGAQPLDPLLLQVRQLVLQLQEKQQKESH